MSVALRTHPKVVRISSALRADKLHVMGALFVVWSVFDAHSTDGVLEGYTTEAMDSEIGFSGFSAAMQTVGWLEIREATDGAECALYAPRFDEHNGATAKRRATDAKRKKESRESEDCPDDERTDVREMSASRADKKRTREEKRREEKKKTPHSPQGGRLPLVHLQDWLVAMKEKGESPVPLEDPVFTYAAEVGIPQDFLRLAWLEFRHRYSQPEQKRYRDWRAVFRKAVRGNWLKLWFLDDAANVYNLTTVGHQAKRAHDDRRAA